MNPFGWLVPQGMDEGIEDSIELEDLRARIGIVITTFLCTAFSAIPVTALLLAVNDVPRLQGLVVFSGVQTVVLCLLGLALFKIKRSLPLACHFYALTAFLGVMIPGLITGGFWHSPYFQILVLIPAWSFLMLGRAPGLIWSGVALVSLMMTFVASLVGIEFIQVIPMEYLPMARLSASVTGLVLVVVCMYWYDYTKEYLQNMLYSQRNRMAYHAHHDDLTGLANRKLFRQRLEEAINFAMVEKIKAALMYIDLDDFKPINDVHGHEIGDQVLVMVSDRLKSVVRSSDTVARLGGDEFAVVLVGLRENTTGVNVAEQIVNELQQPINVPGGAVAIRASVGVVAIPDNGAQVDQLLSQADKAMYQAKGNKSRICALWVEGQYPS